MVTIAGAFNRGRAFSREQERLANAEMRAQAEERQLQIERQRRNTAMDALTGQYGAVAGAPTEYGQLEGISQRRTQFDRGIAQEDAQLQREDALRAAARVPQLREQGATDDEIAARLDSMPDAVFGPTPEAAASARQLAMQNIDDPQGLAAALTGEIAQQQYSDPDFFVDPETGEETYGRMVLDSRGQMVGFEPIDYQPVQPQRVDASVARDPSGIYQRDPRTGELFLVGRAPQPRGGGGGGDDEDFTISPDLFNIQQSLEEDVFNAQQSAAEQALQEVGVFSAGFANTLTGWLGGTPAKNLNATIDTLQSDIVFTQLEQMREEAARMGQRGSGLAHVTQREIELLGRVLGALDPQMGPDRLRESLRDIIALRERIYQRRLYLNAVQAGVISEEEAVQRLTEQGLAMNVYDRNRDYGGAAGFGGNEVGGADLDEQTLNLMNQYAPEE